MRSVGRWTVLTVVVGVIVTSMGAVGACAAEPRQCPPTISPLYGPAGSCLRFGITTPSGPLEPAEVAGVTALTGVSPTVNMFFEDFTAIPPIAALNAVIGAGAEPIVTWEPWRHVGDGTYDRAAFSMSSIVAGTHDDYLYRWADELVAWGSTVYLRFAHEPNGDWYPWSPAGGTPPELYVAAWRHVHDLFASKNAVNVKWVWAPNVPISDAPLSRWYPGADYVDVLGVDGYNWGSVPGHRWTSPNDLFGPSLDQLRELAPDKPILVTEVGCAEAGGSKADWIADLVDYLDEADGVTGFVWFDHDKEADWGLTSSPEAGQAMARALEEVGLR
ncbi:glycosyl hydrolase [Gordonia amicalis]|uniref:glycoside hydrolase family 26 protein n=1 Tax=Gordonia amicalis TaxID=89053 RepID=UPI0022A7F3D2|nr:glycosyl hydrolase [Gordonia amicalis]MCZ0913608.1 glycosyl hydrolase [Gordonia amicalis]